MFINGRYNQVKDSSSNTRYRGSYKGGTQDNYYYAMADLDNISTSSQLTFISGQYKLNNYNRSQNGYYDSVSLGRISVDTYCKKNEHNCSFNPDIYQANLVYVGAQGGGYACNTNEKTFRGVGKRNTEFDIFYNFNSLNYGGYNKPSYFKIFAKIVNSNEYS